MLFVVKKLNSHVHISPPFIDNKVVTNHENDNRYLSQ